MKAESKSVKPFAIEGQDGFLFLAGDSNALLNQHVGKTVLSQDTIVEIAALHVARQEAQAVRGGQYCHVIMPNKETVLADLLPPCFGYESLGPTPVRRYLSGAPKVKAFTVFDPTPLAQMPPAEAYRRGDTHWTSAAAIRYFKHTFATFDRTHSLVEHLQRPVERIVTTELGDLGIKMPGNEPYDVLRLLPAASAANLRFKNKAQVSGCIQVYRSDAPLDERTLLMTHDSFGYAIIPFLANIFRSSIFIHTPDYDPGFAERLAPDLYLNAQIERFLPRVPSNSATWLSAQAGAASGTTSIDDEAAVFAALDH